MFGETAALCALLDQLSGTKESIRKAKDWLLDHSKKPETADLWPGERLMILPNLVQIRGLAFFGTEANRTKIHKLNTV